VRLDISFTCGTYQPGHQLFMGAVGLVFAPLAPLVVVAAAIVFWISSWVYKYQLMYVFISKVESGGVRVSSEFSEVRVLRLLQRIWNVVINRLLTCVVLMQLLMILSTSSFCCKPTF